MSTVAICIPTYNQASYLERAVRSALAQTHPCEVWVADDASTDQTPEVMARLLQEFPRIKHCRHRHNLGMSGNPRWVVQQPATEYIVKLDSDDELYRDYVEKLVWGMRVHPSAGYAHGAVQEIDGTGRRKQFRLLARDSGFQTGEDSLKASVTGYRVAANICLFRRAALQAVDYYRSDLPFADDWDLAVRLADNGWGNVYFSEVLANYRVWDTPDHVRSRRKLAEVEGCRRVIEESLIPAFLRRDWSLHPITVARRRQALEHAKSLALEGFSESEREQLKAALLQLGDSPALRWKFRWIRTPLAPWIQLPSTLTHRAKLWCKSALYQNRS